MSSQRATAWWKIVGPGLLVAATGVGAGDLATATFAGIHLGCAVLWAVVVGAVLKYVLNEGLTRWQLVTGTTLLEGTVSNLGAMARWGFFVYLVAWSYLVAMALMSACGAAAHAIWPLLGDASADKIFYGVLHSLVAVILLQIGGYRLFEAVMRFCIGVMFVTVCVTAVALAPPWTELIQGLLIPRIPNVNGSGLAWTIALLGGVGGTVTVLCYGYWIREEQRTSAADLSFCRIDLAVGYAMTALFGLSMVIIGSQVGQIDAKGVTLIVEVARMLGNRWGNWGEVMRWAFLLGAWGAVFSSLLGVWQSVPYLFTDFWNLWHGRKGPDAEITSRSPVYRVYLALIATVPITGLVLFNFSTAMKVNGIIGAVFIPMLSAALLILNSTSRWLGSKYKNSWFTTTLLLVTLIISAVAGAFQIASSLER